MLGLDSRKINIENLYSYECSKFAFVLSVIASIGIEVKKSCYSIDITSYIS